MLPVQHVPTSEHSELPERVLTWQKADLLSPYEAIDRWFHHDPPVLEEHGPEHCLEHLALMAVSAEWLTRWQPISMHRAILAGATPDQVADAAGTSVRNAFEQWKHWADTQRHSIIAGRPGVTKDAYETVRARFAVSVGHMPAIRLRRWVPPELDG
jgi:hypothetical protein